MADFTNMNVFGEAKVGLDIYEGGVKLSEKYLSATGNAPTATDSALLDGLDSTQFARSDQDQTVTGDITISKNKPRLKLVSLAYTAGHEPGVEFTNTANQNAVIKHTPEDSVTLGDINAQALIITDNGAGVIAGLEVQGEIYSQGGKVWHSDNDGAGSGLDADLLNGIALSSFARIDSANIITGHTQFRQTETVFNNNGSVTVRIDADMDDINESHVPTLILTNDNRKGQFSMGIEASNNLSYLYPHRTDEANQHGIRNQVHIKQLDGTFGKIWHSLNDGAGSGLDADLFDGHESTQFIRSDANNTMSANLIFRTNSSARFGYRGESGFTGGWARGTHIYNKDGSTEGGYGFYGTATTDGKLNASRFIVTGNQSSWHNEGTAWLVAKDDGVYHKGAKLMTSGGGGSGSGLDADTVDTLHGSQLVRNDQSGKISNADYFKVELASTTFSFDHTNEFNTYKTSDGTPATMYINFRGGDVKIGTGSATKRNLYVGNDIYAKETHKVWHAGNDGAGSGMNADTVDSIHANQFLRNDGNTTMGSDMKIQFGNSDFYIVGKASSYVDFMSAGDINIHADTNNNSANQELSLKGGNNELRIISSASGQHVDNIRYNGHKVWHAGNDGAGSSLDADTVDGLQASQLLRADASDIKEGLLTMRSNLIMEDSNDTYSHEIKFINNTSAMGLDYSNSGDFRIIDRDLNSSIFTFNIKDKTLKQGGNIYWNSGNDGATSGLDADMVDGVHVSQLLRSDVSSTVATDKYIDFGPNSSWSQTLRIGGNGHTDSSKASVVTTDGNLHIDSKEDKKIYLNYYTGAGINFGGGNGSVVAYMHTDGQLYKGSTTGGNKYWHSGNDGSGSGLDADKLDGLSSGSFLRSDSSDSFTGQISTTLGAGSWISQKTSGDVPFKCDTISGSSYGAWFRQRVSGGYMTIGSIGSEFGFYGYTDAQTANGTNSNFHINTLNGNVAGNGNLTMSKNITSYSDERIKGNIEKISNPLRKIAQISGYTFERKDLEYKRDTGVLAQEIEKVLPELITTIDVSDNKFIEDGKLKTVDYGKISGLLIECIKELNKEINELKGLA